MAERPILDQDGWYRIQGYVYLGPDKPEGSLDAILRVETVTHELANGQTATERRVYQNNGASLDLGDQIIPNMTWTWRIG